MITSKKGTEARTNIHKRRIVYVVEVGVDSGVEDV